MSGTVLVELPAGDPVVADFLEASGHLPAAMTVRASKPPVYLWLLAQVEEQGHETYDSCVVAAADQRSAQRVHPSAFVAAFDDDAGTWVDLRGEPEYRGDWAHHPDMVTATRIGMTSTEQPGTVICASFNAG